MRGICYLFLSVLSQVCSDAPKVSGYVGQNVTLPCAYDAQAHGLLSFCWGQGELSILGCSNSIIDATDWVEPFISKSRYQLLGCLSDGDVSLTILNAQPGDGGMYGCRVEVPGWFNDYKVHIYLAIEEAPQTSTQATINTLFTTSLEQPIAQLNLTVTAGRLQAISEVGVFEHAEGDDSRSNKKSKAQDTKTAIVQLDILVAFRGAGNICRIAAIVSLTVLIITIFIASEKGPRPVKPLKTSTMENVYEII